MREIGADGGSRTHTPWVAPRDSAVKPRPPSWLPDHDSNVDSPVNNRMSCHWTIGKWWRHRESNPARRSCKDRLQPAAIPVGCWCLELVSSQPLRVFSAALSPDQLPRLEWCGRRESNPHPRNPGLPGFRIVCASRAGPTCVVALRDSAVKPRPQTWCVPEDSNLPSANLPVS